MAFYFVGCKSVKKQEGAAAYSFPEADDGALDHGVIFIDSINAECPQNTAGLEVWATYEYEQANWFSVCDSWHEYSHGVEELAGLVGFHEDGAPDAQGSGPFRELILYGRFGGFIGPVASAKLAADFIEWDESARSIGEDAFYDWYARMRKVFEYAGEAGAVWSEGETYR